MHEPLIIYFSRNSFNDARDLFMRVLREGKVFRPNFTSWIIRRAIAEGEDSLVNEIVEAYRSYVPPTPHDAERHANALGNLEAQVRRALESRASGMLVRSPEAALPVKPEVEDEDAEDFENAVDELSLDDALRTERDLAEELADAQKGHDEWLLDTLPLAKRDG